MDSNYFEPDPIMSFYQIRSPEEFVNLYLVKGEFGPKVPKDIRESFTTAEYLMAHSFFHWQLYDEAFWKVLSIYEMAVQFKCKELGVELRNSRGWKKTLDVLHKELIEKLKLEDYQYSFDKIRNLRNDKAHPEIYSFGGTLYKTQIEFIVKFIKMIFDTKSSEIDGENPEN